MGKKKYQIFQLILFMAKGYNKAENMGFYEPKNDGKRDGQVKRNIVSGFIYKRITGYILCTKIFSLSNRYIKKEGTKYEIEYLIAEKIQKKKILGQCSGR